MTDKDDEQARVEAGASGGEAKSEPSAFSFDQRFSALESRFSAIEKLLGGGARKDVGGAHVNAGPTGHVNQPGHADFTRGSDLDAIFTNPNPAASHVNAGPTGHANVPGHADFTRIGAPDIFTRPGIGASHVNAGPTGHANKPGHADFTVRPDPRETLTLPAQVTQFTLANGAQVRFGDTKPGTVKVGNLTIVRR